MESFRSKSFTYTLDQNELTLQDDTIGIFKSEPEPISFLSTASIKEEVDIKPAKVA